MQTFYALEVFYLLISYLRNLFLGCFNSFFVKFWYFLLGQFYCLQILTIVFAHDDCFFYYPFLLQICLFLFLNFCFSVVSQKSQLLDSFLVKLFIGKLFNKFALFFFVLSLDVFVSVCFRIYLLQNLTSLNFLRFLITSLHSQLIYILSFFDITENE